MKLDEAISTAMLYERGVYKAYYDAMEKTSDPSAKRMFKILAEEEMGHMNYLKDRLQEWQSVGKITVKELPTSIPARQAIGKALIELRLSVVEPQPTRLIPELELLKAALQAEVKTSNFYKEMVAKLDGDGKRLFRRFVEIEEGHEDIVQAQIDCASGLGVFLDNLEFGLEVE